METHQDYLTLKDLQAESGMTLTELVKFLGFTTAQVNRARKQGQQTP